MTAARTTPRHQVTASERARLRGADGKWQSDDWSTAYDGGLYVMQYSGSQPNVVDPAVGPYATASVYYWLMHYNDPDVRKSHYPDKFSRLAEMFKNYAAGKVL